MGAQYFTSRHDSIQQEGSEGDGGQIPKEHQHPLPPGQSTKVSFLLFPVSLPQTSNTLTCDREKNTSFDSILQRLYLQKKCEKKRKIYFLAGGSVWNMSQESCFWFMLNCTLNTERCSCPLFILFQAVPTSHSHTQKIYTPTHHTFKEFEPSC